jgi:hypothetical protein
MIRRVRDLGVALERMEALGRMGLTVSVCCGPSGDRVFAWSVNVMTARFQAFDRPFTADGFCHAIEIAETECRNRGWIKGQPV